jgi:hypothetical protein
MSPRRRAAVTIVGFVVVAAITSLLVGFLVGDRSVRDWFLSCAGALELWGVVLVAWPELAPLLQRLRTVVARLRDAATVLARRAINWVRLKVGRPRPHTVSVSPGGISAAGGVGARGVISVSPGATDAVKIEYLLRQDRKTQDRFSDVEEKLGELPERWQADIEAAAGTLRQEHKESLTELRREHLTQRLGGVAFLVIGLVLSTWGNLI